MNNDKISRIFLIIILIIGSIHVFWWGSQKQGFYVDELYTYGLSNSYMNPFFERTDNYLNAYHKGTEFFDYLTVSEQDNFEIASVWYNQEQDVHPPFYYAVFHVISSVFSDTFSKWFGLGINYVFLILSTLLFYKICRQIYKTKTNIVLSVFMFMFSLGILNCFLFIRMYMMLVFWILLYLWVMIRFITVERLKKREMVYYVLNCGIIVSGFLTHYYFIIPALVLSFLYVLYCILKKQIKRAFYYILSCVAAAIASQYIFEYSYNHIFIGYRGVEAIRNIKSSNFWDNVGNMIQYTNEQLFGGLLPVIVALFAISFLVIIYKRGKRKAEDKKQSNERRPKTAGFWIKTAILITTVVFFVFVTKTAAPLQAQSRYLFAVYPFAILSVFTITDWILSRSMDKAIRIITVVIVFVCVISSYCIMDEPEFLFNRYASVPRVVEENYHGSNAIYLTDCSYRYVSDSHILAMHDNIYIADFNTAESLTWFEDNEVILYINHWAYNPTVGVAAHDLEYYLTLVEQAGYGSCDYLGDTEHSKVYVLNR